MTYSSVSIRAICGEHYSKQPAQTSLTLGQQCASKTKDCSWF